MGADFIQRSRHGTVFHFRRRVPKDLRERMGRAHIVASLHTELRDDARQRGQSLAAATDHLFWEWRGMPKDKKPTTFQTNYELSVELDPPSGNVKKILVRDVKAEEQPAVDRHIENIRASTATRIRLDPQPDRATPTVAEATAAVLADPNLKATSRKRYAQVFGHVTTHFGGHTSLSAIPQERFAVYADSVNATLGWSDKTKGLYITAAQRLFGFQASRNSAVPKITAKGLKPKRQKPAGHDRPEFSLDDYRILFENAAKYRAKQPAKWWVTVACAFLGCRLEELAQAHIVGDIQQDPGSGIRFIKIQETDDESEDGREVLSPKSVKTLTGWRKVPIHPALVDAGFIDYLEAEREAGATTPFGRYWSPYRDPDTDGVKHSHSISKWGSRELKKLRTKHDSIRGKLSYFQSMRHGFTTLLALEDIGEEWRAGLAGHAYGGMNAQVYNKAKNEVNATAPILERGLITLTRVLGKVIREPS
jgi:hypothetical protein